MNCKEFLIVFEERGGLTEAATLHLKICADCEKTSREQTRLWQMIEDLPRVDAPKNFDFRVKARIADSKPTDFHPRVFPALRYVLPLGVAVLIVGLFIFRAANFSNQTAAPRIAATAPQSVKEDAPANLPSTTNPPAPESSSVILPDEKFIARTNDSQPVVNQKTIKNSLVKARRESGKDNFKGTATIASTGTPIFTPRGIEPNRKIETSPNADNQNLMTVEKMLAQLGIESVAENGERKVKAVKQNTLAEHSGVKVGDVVEAIDGKKISTEQIRGKTIEGKILTVRRGAEKIEITLKNQ